MNGMISLRKGLALCASFWEPILSASGLCFTNGARDSLFKFSRVATAHEQLPPYDVQDQELAFIQHGAEAARFAIDLV
ncbi:hypothetical protein [Phaeobacter sp. JL2872]|uniref:hypothetical protein n=1 Tax=Phaeobacter sp. JL2872 TaxID=2461377 RepID=UPI001402050D|nr:hypothetical protein [Phaeobacter sp. JL2872]